MFFNCSSLTSLDISNFKTSEVINMDYMFDSCSSLKILNLSNLDTSKVKGMGGMFHDCKSLISLDLSSFNSRNVINMNSMFHGCRSLTSLELSNLDVSNVRAMNSIFRGCSSLKYLNISNFKTSNLNNIGGMFYGCLSLTSLDLSNFDTSHVTNMNSMFFECISLNSLNISSFNTSNTKNMNSLFDSCSSLTSLDLSNFDTSQVTTMAGMFYGCKSLKSLNLINFNTSNVEVVSGMFYECISLNSLNMDNFDISSVSNINYMFYNCSSLISLNLLSFNTSHLTSMSDLFYGCSSLISLNLSNFDTSKVTNMCNMFRDCFSLISLDLSNFDTSNTIKMNNMFNGCTNLEYINLKNFTDINLTEYTNIFYGVPENIVACGNDNMILTELKLKHCFTIYCSDDWKLNKKKIIFYNNTCIDNCSLDVEYEYNDKCYSYCPNNVNNVYYLNNNNKICKCELEKCLICSAISLIKNLCIKCNIDYYPKENDPSDIGEFINCYKEPEGYYLDNNNSIYKKCYHRCKTCEIEGNDNVHNCLECNYNYPFNINNYNTNYMNCYENCSYYYYFDENNNFYCTNNYSCPEEYNKFIPDKMKCVNDCNKDDIFKIEINNICYKENPEKILSTFISTDKYNTNTNTNYILNNISDNELEISDNNYIEMNCNGDKSSLKIKLYDCPQNSLINDLINNICKLKYQNDGLEILKENKEYTKNMDLLLDNIEYCFISSKYDDSNIDNGLDEIIVIDKIKITLTTSENQKNQIDNNMTIIDLGDCEDLLRENYNITTGKLYMKKIDIIQDGMKIPKIEYEIYGKLNGSNLEKLNISICNNVKINLLIPISLSENIDKLNSSSGYYNDICYPATSDFGTDITLKDRKEEFINNNKTVCQEDCDFSEYNYNQQKVKCSCKVKDSSTSIINMNINKQKLYENFKNIENILNINILKCYKILFIKDSLLYNIGSYITIFIIIFHIISIFVFFINQIHFLAKKIRSITLTIKNQPNVKRDNKESINKVEEQKSKKKNIFKSKSETKNKKKKRKKNIIDNKQKSDKITFKKKKKKNKQNNNPPNKRKKYKNNKNSNNNNRSKTKENIYKVAYNVFNINNNNGRNITSKYGLNESQKSNIKLTLNKKDTKIIQEIYTDDEINTLSYDLALEYDKRKYCEYYISLLKTKHILIFSFFYNQDYNSKIIKMDLFIFSFTIYYTVNALFFDDDSMHEIYKSKGSFDIEYQLPKIIYSSLISMILNILLKFLAISNNEILEFKKNKSNSSDIYKRENNLKNKLKIKFILFFIISRFFYYFSGIIYLCFVQFLKILNII